MAEIGRVGVKTGNADAPAILDGRWQTAMSMDDADDMVDLLNRLDREQAGAVRQ